MLVRKRNVKQVIENGKSQISWICVNCSDFIPEDKIEFIDVGFDEEKKRQVAAPFCIPCSEL
jgi:hypothetical protein